MLTYITVSDVDTLAGSDWTTPDKKDRAVMLANLWLSSQGLPTFEDIPDEVTQAGAEIAKEAAQGKIFAASETGVLSKSVQAGEVSSSKSFSSTAKTYTSAENIAMALLTPWLGLNNGVFWLNKV